MKQLDNLNKEGHFPLYVHYEVQDITQSYDMFFNIYWEFVDINKASDIALIDEIDFILRTHHIWKFVMITKNNDISFIDDTKANSRKHLRIALKDYFK